MALRALKSRDIVTKVVSKCGNFRVSAVTSRSVLQETIDRHDLYGRTHHHMHFMQLCGTNISFAALLSSFLQDEERVISRFSAEEATTVSESLALGEVRSFVSNVDSETSPGALHVQRILYNRAKPVMSVTVLHVDEMVEALDLPLSCDWASIAAYNLSPHVWNFFRKSEGTDSSVWLGCKVSEVVDGDCRGRAVSYFNGGLLLQPIVTQNGSSAEMTKRLQKCLQMALADDVFLSRLTTRSEEHGCAVQDMLSLATGDYEGAMEVALALRQSTVDMTNCRGFICPLREAFGLSAKEFQVAIDARTATRTPIDFFCTKAGNDALLILEKRREKCCKANVRSA